MALKMRKNLSPSPPLDCPLMTCMSFLGGAWTPSILWYLCAGPRRFSELKMDIPGISPKMLTARLRELETSGVVQRTVKPTSPPSVEYALTDLGQELVPAIMAIVSVGERLKKLRAGNTATPPNRAPKTRAAPTPATVSRP
jgi:DNA-binding HxlR family transcriptional regulator